jgi:hypothetical protein
VTIFAGTFIDVSEWQDSLPDLTGVSGVIARAGIGTKPDKMFVSHIAAAKRAGLIVGSYWFNWGSLSVSDQVNAYIAREKEVGGVDLHVIDWESNAGFTAAQTTQFISLYKSRTLELIGLYASESWFKDCGQDWNWIANYSREPVKQYDMWQYGSFRGVDGNHAKQRIITLAMESKMAQATVTDESPKIVTKAAGTPWYDLDGSTVLLSNAQALTARTSPYGVGTKRAIFATYAGSRRIVLISPVTVTDVVDTTKFSDTDIAAAKAEQKSADQAAIDAANAAATKAQADLATAAGQERERVALAFGQDEASRIRSL